MLSRVADSLYWIAQNMERADNTAKLLSVQMISKLENYDPSQVDSTGWSEVLELTGNSTAYHGQYNEIKKEQVVYFISFDSSNANSIFTCISIARENAKAVREIIPIELWEVINDLYLSIKQFPIHHVTNEQLNDFFHMIREKYFVFQGVISSLMLRGEGYQFIMFGKHIERIRSLARTLDVYYHKKQTEKFEINYHYWSTMLNAVSGYESYLQKYQTFMDSLSVVNYLIFDEKLPRSVRFSVQQLLAAFYQLEGDTIHSYATSLFKKLKRLDADMNYTSLKEVDYTPHAFFEHLQRICNEIGVAIVDTYYLGEIKSI